jgi:hypothetical protein
MTTCLGGVTELQLEHFLGRASRMSIESQDRWDQFIAFGGAFLLLLCSLVMGLCSPPAISVSTVYRFLENESFSSFTSPPVDVDNRFLDCDLRYLRKPTIHNLTFASNTSILIRQPTGNDSRRLLSTRSVRFSRRNLSASEFIPILRKVMADKVVLDIDLHNRRGITGLILQWRWENPKERVIESFLRFCFGFGCALFLIQFLISLKALPFKVWHLEQQFTAFLLVVAVLFDNPIHFIACFSTTPGRLFQSVMTPALTIVLLVYVVVILDLFQYKNQALGRYFLAPKVCLVMFFLMDELLGLAGLAHGVAAVWATALIMTTSFGEEDAPERHRFAVYTWVFAAFAAVLIVIEFVLPSAAPETPIKEIMKFALATVFVILMTMLHCRLPLTTVDPQLRGIDPALQSVNVGA